MQVFEPEYKPVHGGGVNAAAQKFNIPLEKWLDLSTGINPNGRPVPHLPSQIFSRLPEEDDGLSNAAREYYQADNFLAVAGSQQAIQILPQLRTRSKVGVMSPGYQEHAYCWHMAGHDVYLINGAEVESYIDELDVLVLINPNNPTGERYTQTQLLQWYERLAKRNGWLVVDEAFIDAENTSSVLEYSNQQGLIVLRSLGKFFGLAGLRVGFVFTEKSLRVKLSERIGPWAISHPSRYVAANALCDTTWQSQTRISLAQSSQKLYAILSSFELKPDGGTHLFQWVQDDDALYLFKRLAEQGILVRFFPDSNSLRFGLPKDHTAFSRLENAIYNATEKVKGVSLV